MASRKQLIYREFLRRGLSWLRSVKGLRLWNRKQRFALYVETEFLHNLYVSILEPDFIDHDIWFLNKQARWYIDNADPNCCPNLTANRESIREMFQLGFVPKGLNEFVLQVLPDEGEFEHAAEILRRLFEPREDPAAFFEPPDQTLDDVASPVCLFVELNGSNRAVLVLFRGDHRLDPEVEQVLVDPISSVSLVSAQGKGPRNSLAIFVE